MPARKEPTITRWYQEPFAWLIFGIIGVAVCWGTFQLVTALRHADEVVIDDYYSVGQAINHDLTREQRARELNLKATVEVQQEGATIVVSLSGTHSAWPAQLRLRLLPASRGFAAEDVALVQTAGSPSVYSGRLQQLPVGRYFIQIETLNTLIPEEGYKSGWRLNNEVRFVPDHIVELSSHG